jgi:hypothetical protein
MSRTVKGSTAKAGKLSAAQAMALAANGMQWKRDSKKFMVQSFKDQITTGVESQSFNRSVQAQWPNYLGTGRKKSGSFYF